MGKLRIREKDKLRIHYGYDRESNTFDFIADWPMMQQGRCDAYYLFDRILTEEVRAELERRGWDITTLKFSIAPKLIEPTRPERFQTLLAKYKKEIESLNR